MIARIAIVLFSSAIGCFGYMVGQIRLTSGLLIGFGAMASFFLGFLFYLPASTSQTIFPVLVAHPPLPYMVLGCLLCLSVVLMFKVNLPCATYEEAYSEHFRSLAYGVSAYLGTIFLASLFWFPGDGTSPATAGWMSLGGTLLFLAGLGGSSILLYRASKGATERNPDLMRRSVLAIFALFQLDKVPLLIAYLLISEGRATWADQVSAFLAIAGYLIVAAFCIRIVWDSREKS